MHSHPRPLYKVFYLLSLIVFVASLAYYIQGSVSLKRGAQREKPAENETRPVSQQKRDSLPLDINEASSEELERIRGIGPVLAGRIVTYRQKQGGFDSVEELKKVKGIGPVTFKEIKPYVTLKSGER